jgi:chloramphenicol 3-O-phosphotransferase
VADRSDAQAVMITGAYGTGKTSLVEEIADILEERGDRYGALDLDWLAWFDPGSGDHSAGRPVMLKNVDAVVGNYYDAGVRRFALAGSIASTDDVDDLRVTLGMPLSVVRLTLPFEEIERRLSTSVTAGRQDDLRVAKEWLAKGRGEGIGDFVIENDLPVRDVALEILAALTW